MDFLGFTLKRFVWKTKVCDHQVENQSLTFRESTRQRPTSGMYRTPRIRTSPVVRQYWMN